MFRRVNTVGTSDAGSRLSGQNFASGDRQCSICLQTFAPGISIAQVARRYAMNANQIFNWLKDARFAPSAEDVEVEADTAVFLPVDVCNELTANSLPSVLEPGTTCQSYGCPPAGSHGRVEIALSGGHRITVEGDFDGDALARLLKGLVS